MNNLIPAWRSCTLAMSGLAVLFAASAAADPVGNTLFVYGDVKVERPQSLGLNKGDALFAGDTIVTGARSRAQLLMKDGAKVALRPATTFTIDEYVEAGEEVTAPDGSVVVAEESSAVSTLIKGGFRTITGAIGDKSPEAFEARTPVATLGIRGTDFVAVYCNAATSPCSTAPGIPAGEMPEDGLYVGASSGQVVLSNDAGSLAISPGQYAYVSQPNEPPQKLPGPPPIIYANSAVGSGEAEEAEGEGESAATEEATATEESAEASEESADATEESSDGADESADGAQESADAGESGQAQSEAVADTPAPAESGGESAVGGTATSGGGVGGGSAGSGGATASSEGTSSTAGGDTFPAIPVAENPWSDATTIASSESDEESAPGADSGGDAGTATTPSAPAAAPASQATRRRPAATDTGSSPTEAFTGGGDGAAGGDDGSGDSFGTPDEPVIEIIAEDENGTQVDLVDGEPEPVGDPTVFRDVSLATGPLLQSESFTSVSSNFPANVVTGPDGASVSEFKNASPGSPDPRGSTYTIGSGSNFNVGFDPTSGLRWGRWSAGEATLTAPSAAPAPVDLVEQSLHWVLGPEFTSPPALPISGTATFDVIAGNTDPTDNFGNVGVLGSASLQADFTNQTVMADVLLSIAGSVWSGNGTSALDGHQFGADFSSILIDGEQGAGGNFSGFFTGGNQGAVTGAGLSYALQSFDGTTVGGAVVFGPARP